MLNIKTKLRRAFTIVELVVVIAVIAALAAILIPTFANVINAANQSADTQMLKNINTTLNAENILSGVNTPSEALDIAAEAGYNIEKLTPSSDGDIVYDQSTTSFALIDSEGKTVYSQSGEDIDPYAPTTWYIVSSVDQMDCSTCSYILNGEFITSSASSVSAKSTASSVRSVAMATSSVATVSATGALSYTGMAGLNTYECIGITEINYKYEESDGYTDYYTNNTKVNLTLNIDIQSTAVKLTLNIDASITIDSYNSSSTITSVTGSGSVEVNDYNGSVYQGTTSVTWKGTEGEEVSSDVSISTSAGVIETGTEKYPYLIETASELATIGGTASKGIYYKLANDITLSHSGKLIASFYGTLDGDDNYIYGLGGDGSTFSYLFSYLYGATIKNLNVQYECTTAGDAGFIAYYIGASGDYKETTFDNVDIYGTLNYAYSGRNQSPYMYAVSSNSATLTFVDCDNYADISFPSNGYNAAFVGFAYYGSIVIKDCNNYGYISGGNASVILANVSGWDTYATFTIDNVKNYGSVVGTIKSDLFCWSTSYDDSKVTNLNGGIVNANDTTNKYYGACYVLGSLDGLTIAADSDGQIVITPATTLAASTYMVSISSLGTSYYSNGSKFGTSNMTITSTISASDITGSSYATGLYNYQFRQTDTYLTSSMNAAYALPASEYTFTESEAKLGYKVISIEGVNYYLISDAIYTSTSGDNDVYAVITNPTFTISVTVYDYSGHVIGSETL